MFERLDPILLIPLPRFPHFSCLHRSYKAAEIKFLRLRVLFHDHNDLFLPDISRILWLKFHAEE